MNQAENFYNTIRSHPINDEMPGSPDAARRLDPHPTQTERVCADTPQPWNFNRPEHLWAAAQGRHRGYEQQTVTTSSLYAVRSCTLEQDGINLVLCRLGETIGQLLFRDQTRSQPGHQTLVQEPLVIRVGHGRVSARFYIGDACLHCRENLFLFGTGIVNQAHDGFLDECRGARGPAFGDLLLDHALKLSGS